MHAKYAFLFQFIPQAQNVWQRSLGHRFYAKKLPALPPINESDLEETFVRGSGPGGANIPSEMHLESSYGYITQVKLLTKRTSLFPSSTSRPVNSLKPCCCHALLIGLKPTRDPSAMSPNAIQREQPLPCSQDSPGKR